jgi:glycosyltransferase involved in cell wall biosynthesis
MKILLANSTSKVGGVSTFLLSLHRALTARGHQCELFFFTHGTMDRHLPPDVPVHFGNLSDCLRLVRHSGFEVIHANNIDWTTGISAVRHLGARLVLTAHKARDEAWTYGWTSANCDALVAVSHGIRQDLQRYTDIPIQVVHNGIDLSRFYLGNAPPTAPPIVAWIGRSGSELKNIEGLAAIAPGLRRAGFRLWVIDQHGADMGARFFPEAVRTLVPLAERWEAVPSDAMPALYQDIQASGGCVLSTSTREGLNLTNLEAQASGCSVIASDVRGNNESVSPQHGGLLFPLPMSGDAVAQLVAQALTDKAGLAARQAAARTFVQTHFSLDRMVERYLQLYGRSANADASQLPLRERMRARLRLSPMPHWDRYVQHRLGVGYTQFDASTELAGQGDWRLAAAATAAALRTSPTIFLKPARLARLVETWRRGRGNGGSGKVEEVEKWKKWKSGRSK